MRRAGPVMMMSAGPQSPAACAARALRRSPRWRRDPFDRRHSAPRTPAGRGGDALRAACGPARRARAGRTRGTIHRQLQRSSDATARLGARRSGSRAPPPTGVLFVLSPPEDSSSPFSSTGGGLRSVRPSSVWPSREGLRGCVLRACAVDRSSAWRCSSSSTASCPQRWPNLTDRDSGGIELGKRSTAPSATATLCASARRRTTSAPSSAAAAASAAAASAVTASGGIGVREKPPRLRRELAAPPADSSRARTRASVQAPEHVCGSVLVRSLEATCRASPRRRRAAQPGQDLREEGAVRRRRGGGPISSNAS